VLAGLLLFPVLTRLPVAVFGDEEEERAPCSPASRPSQMTPATHPVDGTGLFITEGQLSFTGTNAASDYHRSPTIAMDGSGHLLVAWEGQ
jgi:hypothetical protein